MGNKLFEHKRIKLYLWLTAIFLSLWIVGDIVNESHRGTFLQRAINHAWRTSFIVPLNFLLFEFTLKRIKQRKVIYSIVIILAHLAAYSYGLYLWREFGLTINVYTSYADHSTSYAAILDQLSYSVMSLLFFGLARHFYDHYKLKQATQQLQIEKQQAELNYLKSQTNPHFLFNTLNNIYSLTRKKSDQAPETVMRLSKILRFMLYETSGEHITIDQEIRIIADYIELEKLRYDKSLVVTFNHDVEDPGHLVPPLLLVPLVENAFKHGVSETRVLPYVNINLTLANSLLSFQIENSIDPAAGKKEIKENIGLSNLRRQLEILYRQYDLSIDQQPSSFIVNLKINLASHV